MGITDLNLDAVRVGAQRSLAFAAEHANGREYLPEAVFEFFDRDLPAVLAELEQARKQLDVARELIGTVRTIAETWRNDPGAYPDGAADPLEQIATVLLGPRSTRER